jgi:hypothetical protein
MRKKNHGVRLQEMGDMGAAGAHMTRATAKGHLAMADVARRNESLSRITPQIIRQAGVAAVSKSRI